MLRPEFTINDTGSLLMSYCHCSQIVFLTVGPMTMRIKKDIFEKMVTDLKDFSQVMQSKAGEKDIPTGTSPKPEMRIIKN